jgi:hypothetical protein
LDSKAEKATQGKLANISKGTTYPASKTKIRLEPFDADGRRFEVDLLTA